MMGASMFAELCHELELLGRAATLDRVPEVLSKLEASYPNVCAALEREAGKSPLIWNFKKNERHRGLLVVDDDELSEWL